MGKGGDKSNCASDRALTPTMIAHRTNLLVSECISNKYRLGIDDYNAKKSERSYLFLQVGTRGNKARSKVKGDRNVETVEFCRVEKAKEKKKKKGRRCTLLLI